jgi:hypothetical protein
MVCLNAPSHCMFETYLSHQIDSAAANFMLKIVPLDHANTVLTGGCTFHLNGAFDHAMDEILRETVFLIVVENDGYARQLRTESFVCLCSEVPHHESCHHQRDQQ